MYYKPDLEEAKKYWKAFWNKEVLDRPLVCVTSPKKGMEQEYKYHGVTESQILVSAKKGDFKTPLESYDKFCKATYFGGEALPYFSLSFGPDTYAGFLGGDIIAPEGHATTWVNPSVHSGDQYDIRLNTEKDSLFNLFLENHKYAAEYAKDKFLISMADLHGNIDALSALRGPQDLCFDLMDYPDEVEEAVKKVADTYQTIYESIYKAGDMENRGTIGWAPTYCDGKFAIVQCDFSCMISKELGERYVIPYIEKEAAYLDHCVYHYDGKEALTHVDNILGIKDIDVIQWVPGDGNPRSIEWMDLLRKIQNAGKGLWIYDWTADEIKKHFKELKQEGLVFSLSVATQDEADELLEYLKNNM